MPILNHAFKEWAAVVERLGSGDQIVMIRTFRPKNLEFILHPTFAYGFASQTTFDTRIKPKYQDFAREAAKRVKDLAHERGLTPIRYFVEVDQVVPISNNIQWVNLDEFTIWPISHLKDYVKKTGYIWIVRAHRLPNDVFLSYTGGGAITHYPLNSPIATDNAQPVIADGEFLAKKQQVLNALTQPQNPEL